MLVFCRYTVLYSAIPQDGTALLYNALCYLQLYLKIYDSEINYLKYRQNIEGNDSFRM